MNNVARHNRVPSQTRPQDCILAIYIKVMLPQLLFFTSLSLVPVHLFTLNPITSMSCSFNYNSLPPSLLTVTGTQAQQAFRSEPRNLTVRMGATAVLKCEVLRASGTVQWVKNGLLLGPQRNLPGFPRYSMIGNPNRGTYNCGVWPIGHHWTYLNCKNYKNTPNLSYSNHLRLKGTCALYT